MKKLKLEIIMALKKGVIEMKKKIFIIAGIIVFKIIHKFHPLNFLLHYTISKL